MLGEKSMGIKLAFASQFLESFMRDVICIRSDTVVVAMAWQSVVVDTDKKEAKSTSVQVGLRATLGTLVARKCMGLLLVFQEIYRR